MTLSKALKKKLICKNNTDVLSVFFMRVYISLADENSSKISTNAVVMRRRFLNDFTQNRTKWEKI